MRSTRSILGAALVAAILVSPLTAQLTATGHQTLRADLLGSTVFEGDELGYALAVGDFDGDSYEDLAIGLPGRTVSGFANAGAVIVVYGSPTGLNGAGSLTPQVIHQNVTNVLEVAEAGDRFGATLVAGDFDDSGTDDLAVGVPFEDLESAPVVTDAGLVQVFYSTFDGLDPANDEVWHQESVGGLSANENGDEFGLSLAACNFGGVFADGIDDLLIGMPGDNFLLLNDSGSVYLLRGSDTGITTVNAVHTGATGFGTPAAAGDRSATSLSCIEFGVDKGAIAFGSPFAEAFGVENSAGIMRVSSSFGQSEIASPYGGSRLGTAVALAPTYTLSYVLYGGMPGFDAGGQDESGRVVVFPSGLTFSQGELGLGETAEPFDKLGEVFAVGDWNDDGQEDVAFGVPGEDLRDADVTPAVDAGTVHVLFSQSGGVGTAAHQTWTWDDPGLGLGALPNDRFGGALAAGDFDGDGIQDLAIGAPTATWSSPENGLLEVLYGERHLLFADNFEIDGTNAWTSTSPP